MASHSRKMVQKISRGLMSRHPLIYVLGWEEERIEREAEEGGRFLRHGHECLWKPSRPWVTWPAGSQLDATCSP